MPFKVACGFWTSFAVALAGSESAPFPFFVTAVTSVKSFTLLAGIVISPVFGSIRTSGLFTVHLPFVPLVPSAVFCLLSSPVKLTLILSTFVESCGFAVTSPLSLAVAIGFAALSSTT